MTTTSDDWRIVEVLKLLRQCVVCPFCGALVATDAGIEAHKRWHVVVNEKVQDIDNKFGIIDEYVRGTGGMEDQIRAAIISTNNNVTQLRTDATSAIGGLGSRITVIETEITRPTTGMLARIQALETLP